MSPRQHRSYLVQAVLVWLAFWLLGLPDYYQQYSMLTLAIGCSLLSLAISLWALYILHRARPETRMERAIWISFYFTVPFAILDTLYCGVHLGHGSAYVGRFWYLSIFYLTPWLTFPPTAWILGTTRAERGIR